MENFTVKTFTVSAEDCRKIIQRFPDDDKEVKFNKIADVKEKGDVEAIAYSHYFSKRIREKFGLNVVVAMSYRQVSFSFKYVENF